MESKIRLSEGVVKTQFETYKPTLQVPTQALYTRKTYDEILSKYIGDSPHILTIKQKITDEVTLFNFICLIQRTSIEHAMERLNSGDILFNTRAMEMHINQSVLNRDTYRNKVAKTKGIYKCKKCGSHNTSSIGRQLRSNDEGQSSIVTCNNCSFTFTIAG